MITVELCDRCESELDNVTTGVVWVQLPNSLPNQSQFRLCAACAVFVKAEQGATEIIRAKQLWVRTA